MKLQIGISATADFEEKTWTFEMTEEDFRVRAGEFVIIDKNDFKQQIIEAYNCGENMMDAEQYYDKTFS